MDHTVTPLARQFAAILILTLALCSPVAARCRQQDPPANAGAPFDWSEPARRDFARRRLDPTHWDLDLLRRDVAASHQHPPLDNLMPYLPAPTVQYVSNGSLSIEPLPIGERTVLVASFDWACFDFNRAICAGRRSRNYCNVVILMSDPATANRAGSMSSRAWPHIQAQGYLETCIGDVTWTFTGYASGANYLNVNKHIFDLEFGRTVLVAPQHDGSLRFQQVESPDREGAENPSEDLAAFWATFADRPGVREFFDSDTAIDQHTPPVTRLLGRRAQREQLHRAMQDWERLRHHLATLDDVGRAALAAFVADEDRRVHQVLLESIGRYGFPHEPGPGQPGIALLPVLSTPPFGSGPAEARAHLDGVAAVLRRILEQNRQEAATHEAFGLDYRPTLSAMTFARFYDSYLVEHRLGNPLYGIPEASHGGLPTIDDLARSNRARAAIGLDPLRAADVREARGR